MSSVIGRKAKRRVSLRWQLILVLAGLVTLAVGLSVLVGSATVTNRYVRHLRMQHMYGLGMRMGTGMTGNFGPGFGSGSGSGIGPGRGMGPGFGPSSSPGSGQGIGPGLSPSPDPLPQGEAPVPEGLSPDALNPGPATLRLSWWESLKRAAGSILGSKQATAGLGFTRAEGELLRSLNLGLLQAGAAVMVLAVAAGLFVARRLTQPITAIRLAVQRLASVPDSVIRHAPRELAELAESFNRMAAGLEEARRQRQNIVADVAHELRTPVTALRSYAEAVRDGVLPAGEEAWQTVLDETLRLSRLIDDLMQLALWEAGQLRLEWEEVDITELVNKVLEVYRPPAAQQGVTLAFRTAATAPEGGPAPEPARFLAKADSQRLGQVLHNLLANALRHTPPGGRIEVTVGPADPPASETIELAVANTGPRIPDDQLDRLFERFYRGDPSRTRQTGGAGLGLTIARQIVLAHGGRIWAENGPDGPIFRVRIPKRPLSAAPQGLV